MILDDIAFVLDDAGSAKSDFSLLENCDHDVNCFDQITDKTRFVEVQQERYAGNRPSRKAPIGEKP